ncbi:SLAP domain-containing protein [Lactobacillus helsingborgensis]|uniref:SLAP domain-containing protein n=1 Tax=Lactobacillus helsingborgensis TaxID=1218494 RepID=UPI0021DFD7D8|nr:SLAP domain-containing protein [Lactobacillus helsingborgensis]
MQDKQDHFSIRKLSIGAASVLLGFTFFGLNSQNVKADTIDPSQNVTEESNRDNSNTETKETSTKDTTKSDAAASKKKNETDLSTFSGLSSFLKGSKSDEVKDTTGKDKTDTTAKDKTDKDKQETHDSTGNSATSPTTGSDEGKQDTTTDKTPTDITGSDDHNSDTGKLPTDVTGDTTNSGKDTDTTQDSKANEAKKLANDLANDDKTGDTPTVINGVAHVYNWNQLVYALDNKECFDKDTQNPDETKRISEIDIMNNITADNKGGQNGLDVYGRTLLIKSYDADGSTNKYKIDFNGYHPRIRGNSSEVTNLTYSNLELWCADYWGIIMTDRNNSSSKPHDNSGEKIGISNLTFNNIDFHGSQMVHSASDTHITFTGTNTAETIYTPYKDGGASSANHQQLFEFGGSNNSIDFKGDFTGATFGGNVIEMGGSNCYVTVEKDVKVTLNPRLNSDGKTLGNNPAENTGAVHAIYISGTGKVDVKGELNINVGIEKGDNAYQGKLDANRATAIRLNDKASQFIVESGGSVKVTTNGDISDSNSGNLIYDGGNFTVKPDGKLSIIGKHMGDYKGTLVQIAGIANVQNGTFEIRLEEDPNHPYDKSDPTSDQNKDAQIFGAGTNPIVLVDVTGSDSKLIVNNPQSLVLDSHLNTATGTSIIGDSSAVTITNVRQKLNFLGNSLTLPPFHTLQVSKDKTTKNIVVDKLVLLNGQGGKNGEYMFTPELWEKVSQLPYFKIPELKNIKTLLDGLAEEGNPINYDTIFSKIIDAAFSNPTNIGYNDIAFGPANSSGFLDIKPENVTATANVDASGKKDGSWTISGIVDGYKSDKDGPDSDLKNPFREFLKLPLGTKAYIMAEIDYGKGTTPLSLNNNIEDPPYQYTNNEDDDLPTAFAGEVTKSENGNYIFKVNVPADVVGKINSNTKIKLTPTANFIDYNPLDKDSKERPVIVSILKIAQDTAAKNIKSKVKVANDLDSQFPKSNPKSKEQVALEEAISNAAEVAKTALDSGYDSSKSVYGAGTVDDVSKREDAALKALDDAMETAQKVVEQIQAVEKAKGDAQKAISAAADKAISRVKQQLDLTDAEKAQYIDAINSAESTALANPSTNKNSIYNPANTPTDITNIQNSFNDLVNKEAAKAEVAGYTENGKKTLGVSSDEIDKALSDQLTAIEGATDIDATEQKAKDAILDKLKTAAKAKVQKDATAAETGLGVKSDTNIDQAVEAAEDAIDGHTDFNDIKNDVTAGQGKVLEAYKDSAKKQLAEVAKTDKGALGVESDSNIDQAVDNANTLIGQASSVELVTEDLNSAKSNVADKFKDSAKKQVQDYADEAKSNLGVDTDAGIDAAAKTAEDDIDGHTAADDIKQDITKGKNAILTAYKDSAKKQLDQAEKDIESKLENVKGLTANDIENAKKVAKDLLTNSEKTGYKDKVDAAETFEDVNTATKDGIAALNKLLTDKSSLGNKNDAIDAINQARDKAINDINDKTKYPNLSDEDRNSLINTIKDDATEGVDNVNKDTDPAKITSDKQAAIDKINSVTATASSKDLADLKNEQKTQTAALQDAAAKAKETIDQIDNKYLSPSDKQYYKDLIDKHAASATNAINSASNKDDIDTAEKDGESNINSDLVSAQVAAAKSQAIAELNQAKSDDKKAINAAHKNNPLSDDDWEKALDDIDNAYTTAITAVSNDHTPADIVTDKNTGINAMKAVVDGISQDKDKADLAKTKNEAIADLEDQAQALHDHIQADPNLSNTEKNDYLDQIASALNNAEQAVSAADKNTVNSAHNAGIEELNNIRNNADLQSARDKALTDLQNEFNADSAAIDGLTNISTAGKTGIKTDLQNAYNEAVNKVKDPASNTIALINSASDAGITNMENILGKAKGLDQTIADDKKKLEDYAQKAVDRINSSDMSDTAKVAAIKDIQKARDDAQAEVGNKLTVEDANQAEKDGETSIQKAEAKANKDDMDKAKDAAKARIEGARKKAKQNLDDVYNALTEDEKKQAQAAYDKAVKDIPALAEQAESAIDNAFDKGAISDLTNDAINSINSTGDTANVAMTKVVAVQAVKDAAQAAKDKLTNERDKAGVDDVANLGIADINAATTSSTVLDIKDNALNSIKNIKDSGTGDTDKDNALWDKKNKANAELAQELDDTTAAIDKLTDLTADQKKQFKDQAQAAHDRAHIRIEGATEDQIDSEKGLGKTNIDKALTDAKLQAVKNVAKADVDKTADDAIDQVNKDDTINKDDKQNIIDNINKDRDKTKEDIDNADTPDKVNNAKNDGEGEIKGHVDNGTSSAKEKQTAKDKLAAAADKIYDRLKNDRDSGKLDYNQYQDLKDKVDNAVDAANGAISNADGTSNINGAESDGESALSGINTDIDKVEAVNTALGKLSDAVNKANDAADAVAEEVGKTPEEQQKLAKQMKDAIEKQRADAAKKIKDAQNAADDPLNAIKTAGQKGVDSITGLTNDYTDKVDQIKTLKQKAEAAKDDLNQLKTDETDENGNPVLTASDVAQGEADIDDAVQTGISDIYQASSVDDAKTAEQKAEDAVELAKLPTELLAEKNKQIAAINQYATAAEGEIDKFTQSDQNKDGLPADTITALKKQVEAAKNKAISKINDVTLAKGASQADFDKAKTSVQNAEKGVAENNETVDFGEAGIDKVKTLAKQKADVVKAKNDKIAELEQKQEEANNKIKDSGLSPADQGPLKDQVQKLVDKAKDQIINISDTDDKGNVKTPEKVKDEADTIINNTVNGFEDQDNGGNKVPGISDIINNAQLDGAKTTAEKILNNKRAQAHDVINGSQLTADQKQKANKAIDDAFNTEKSDIDAKTNINDVPKDEDQIGQAIDAIWTKPTSSDEKNEWFNDEENNALSGTEGTDGVAGLETGFKELTENQKNDPDYKDYLDDINNAIAAIKDAQNIKDASSAYNKGMTSLNKLKALEKVKADANKAESDIDESDLNDPAKKRLKGDVEKVVEDTKDKLNQIDSSVGNASTNKDKIDQITHDAQSDITTIKNDFGIEDQSNDVVNANEEISKNHSDAIDTIHNEFGDDSKTPKTDDAYEKNKHVHSTTDEGINSDKTNADKEISKGAIDDAADIAKDKVNHLKHEDGTDYTDADKNKINEQIDKDAKDAKDKIDKADNITDIDNIRDNGIHQIHQDCSDPSTIDNILHGNNSNDNNGGGGVVAPIQPATPAKNPTTNTSDKDKPNGTNVDLSNASDVTLMHNAYLYDETGKRANKITLGAGSVLTTYGTKTINGKDYYVLVDKGANNKTYYVAAGNIVAATRKLKHNAYIYNQFGKRVKNTGVFKKGKLVKTFGNAVKIRGKKYFIIDKNRFIKAANFAKGVVTVSTAKVEVVPTSAVAEKPQTVVEKTLMHNAYLYDQNGTRANKLIFQAGSKVETVGKKTVKGKVCYELPDGMFIAAGNIDAKKLKLKHNAYVYNQYGRRANKKVLKKHKSVKTYGNSVKINGKRYFITAKGRFVKKANF